MTETLLRPPDYATGYTVVDGSVGTIAPHDAAVNQYLPIPAEKIPEFDNTADTYGRHSPEAIAAEQAAEAPITPTTRRSVRVFDRISELASNTAGRLAERRTTQEYARDKVERGKEIAGKVGTVVSETFVETYGPLKSGYNNLRASGREKVDGFKNFLKQKAEAAHTRKDAIVSGIKDRRERTAKLATDVKEVARRKAAAAAVGAVAIGRDIASVPSEIRKDAAETYIQYLENKSSKLYAKAAEKQLKAESRRNAA